jgi:hypothetical protein
MKIFELFEAKRRGKIHKDHDRAIPNAKLLPQLDQGYGLYRFGLHMATSPEKPNIPSHGATGTTPFFIPYSDADEQIIKHACKAGGFGSVKNLTHGRSAEPEDTHRTSPVNSQARKGRKK